MIGLKQATLAVLAAAGFGFTGASQADLIDHGNGLIYDTVLNVTWTQDANLLGTMEASAIANGDTNANNLIAAIINASVYNGVHGVVQDTPNPYDNAGSGIYKLSVSDFSSMGAVNWWASQAFVNYLNSIDYGNSNLWTLPLPDACGRFYCNSNPLGELLYNELGGIVHGSIPTGPFSNIPSNPWYWTGPQNAFEPGMAWGLDVYNNGQQVFHLKGGLYVWALSPGQVSAVPIPGAAWLFGSGMGLLGLKRRW